MIFAPAGLPIEVQVEKTLGITNKKEIEDLGIEKFVATCRTFALDLLNKMTDQFRALGIWMDCDRPYMTIRNEFIEAAWWTLGRAHERGLLYEALRSTQWCSRDEDARQAGRPGLCAPARGQGPLSGDRDGRMGPSRGLLYHRRGRAHGPRPQCAGSWSGRFRTRADPRLAGLRSGRRTRPFHERGGRVRRQARQGGGRGDHRGPPRRERSLRRGDAGPRLRSLLALQDANPLPRDGPVVPTSRTHQGENGRRGPQGRVVSGMGGRGPSDGLDPEPAGLVPLPPAVLGHPAPDLAVHEVRPLDRRGLLGCAAEGAGIRGRHGPPPAGD